jgi:hypothetical protein
MRRNFTTKFIESLRKGDRRVEHWDLKVPSFGVRVSRTGLATYILYVRGPGTSPMCRKIGRANGHRRITLACPCPPDCCRSLAAWRRPSRRTMRTS